MEQELKLALVSPGDLASLLAALPAPRSVILQRNHYFSDPAGETRQAGVMVRIREEWREGAAAAHRVVLTLKRRLDARRGVFLAWEQEEDLDLTRWGQVAGGQEELMALDATNLDWLRRELGVERLEPEGVLANLRRTIEVDSFLLEVDETRYADGTIDAEVEVETDDPEGARALVERFAAKADVALRIQDRGKYARFRARARQRT